MSLFFPVPSRPVAAWAVFLAVSVPAAFAANESSAPLSLSDALAKALLKNPSLQAYAFESRVAEARILQAGVRPNPARGPGSIALSLASESDVLLEVLDLAGRRIASQFIYVLPAGPHMLPAPVDPLDLMPGIYLVRVTASGESRVTRWVVLE